MSSRSSNLVSMEWDPKSCLHFMSILPMISTSAYFDLLPNACTSTRASTGTFLIFWKTKGWYCRRLYVCVKSWLSVMFYFCRIWVVDFYEWVCLVCIFVDGGCSLLWLYYIMGGTQGRVQSVVIWISFKKLGINNH